MVVLVPHSRLLQLLLPLTPGSTLWQLQTGPIGSQQGIVEPRYTFVRFAKDKYSNWSLNVQLRARRQ